MILTINAGSSSVRLAAFVDKHGELTAVTNRAFAADDDPAQCLQGFLANNNIDGVSAVGHRIVHGGAVFDQPTVVDDRVEHGIEELIPLAPLHNPHALRWLREARRLLGSQVAHVAVFDTSFYTSLPAVAKHYALPSALCEKHGIQRYGFHGIAHQYMWQRYAELHPDAAEHARIISLQLGSGCSVTATCGGTALDTSMGFSPLEGLVMATRSGDLDPSVVGYLQQAEGWSVPQVESFLNHDAGLLGLSGISKDMRELLQSDRPQAQLAVELFCYRARKYIGAYATVLGGVDAIVFGGGVGEHAPTVRRMILQNLEWMGVSVHDNANNQATGSEARIDIGNGNVQVWVLPVDEARILASEASKVSAR